MAVNRREKHVWVCRDRNLELGERTAVMGILNVTPDSFSDGGRYVDHNRAVDHALRMVGEGADIIDVGGESTRPGAAAVEADEERERVVPVLRALSRETDVLLSVDTTKAAVAREALAAGAHIINDVSAMTFDPAMVPLAAETGAGVVLMHMLGSPRTMQQDPRYEDVVTEVVTYLADRARHVETEGVRRDGIALDPGVGFGKLLAHNVSLVAGLDALARRGYPVLAGLSRKSFLGQLTGREVEDRLVPSVAAAAFAITRGAHILRVHDVKETCDMTRVLDTLMNQDYPDVVHQPVT